MFELKIKYGQDQFIIKKDEIINDSITYIVQIFLKKNRNNSFDRNYLKFLYFSKSFLYLK